MPVTASTTLMKNHVAGRPLPHQRALAVVYTKSRSPILVALDSQHRLTVTLPSGSSSTGWAQVDLSSQLAGQGGLGATPVVQCFAVSQDADGSIWLVLAAADAPGADSRVFLSRKLSNTSRESEWATITGGLVLRPVPAGSVFTKLVLGSADDDGSPPFIVGVATSSGMLHHYQLNPDQGDSSWTCLPLILPQNATKCVAATVGSLPSVGRGVYALCQLGSLVNLTFTTMPEMVDGKPITQSRELKLPASFTASTVADIASLPLPNGRTELYLSGDGLYRYSLDAQSQSNLSGEQIADAKLFTHTTQLTVSGDKDALGVDVWALNLADLLVHTHGSPSGTGDGYNWRTPLYVTTETTALATYRAPVRDNSVAAAVALGRSDGSLTLLTKANDTDLWQPHQVALGVRDTAVELDTYTTYIRVTDDDGIPVANRTVHLTADSNVSVLINGQHYTLKGIAKPVTTNASGEITIVLETADLSAPVKTVTMDGASQQADAGADVKMKLRDHTDGAQIAKARRSDGTPLFPHGADDKACAAAAASIKKLMAVHDDLGNPARARQARELKAAPQQFVPMDAFGVWHPMEGGVEALHARVALDAQENLAGEVWAEPGDVLAALFSNAEAVGSWFVNGAQEGWKFVVSIGQKTVAFFFEVAAQAIAAIDWALRHTLGISLNDIVSWLGYLFNWSDILRNHKVIGHILELGFDHAVDQVVPMKQTVIDGASKIRAKLINDKLIVDQSNQMFKDRARKAPAGPADPGQTPEANWGNQQLSTNGHASTSAPVTLDDLTGVMSGLTQTEAQVFSNAAAQFQTRISDHFTDLTWGEILDEFLQIVGSAVIDTVENVALTVLDAVAVLVKMFKQLMTARWDVPVITYVYEQVICRGDGSQLTMLDLVALLLAIPATVVFKAVSPGHRNLFSEATAAAVLQATTWDGMIQALTHDPTPIPAPSELGHHLILAAEAQADSVAVEAQADVSTAAPEIIAALPFLVLAALARSGAAVLYVLREANPEPVKTRYNAMKVGFDWATWAFGSINVGLVTAVTPAHTRNSARFGLDSAITVSQVLVRAKDSYLLWYKLEHPDPSDPTGLTGLDAPERPVLCYIETGFGVLIFIGACASLWLQVLETPPEGTSQGVWISMIELKFLQNCMTGAYRVLAFTPTLPDSWVKESLVLARGAMLGVRALASLGFAGVSIYNTVSDVN